MTLNRPSFVSTAVRCAIALAVSALCAVSAEAGHRARLSRDLADRIAASRTDTVRVIVSGTDAEVSEIAGRHGARVAKRLRGAAVLEVPGAALDALSQDPSVSHLSGDVPVRRLMAVTTAAIGADQVWRGALAGLEGRTGTGIGVAVIDSGIANHQALRDRVVASVDFTGRNGSGRDQYGHGTHVAGIIAGSARLRVCGRGAGRASGQPAGPERRRQRRHQRRDCGHRLGGRAPRTVSAPRHQPIARPPSVRSYREDPLCQAVQRAVDAGMVVVTAAGNFGKTEDGKAVIGGIVSPGNAPAALTVGALQYAAAPPSARTT